MDPPLPFFLCIFYFYSVWPMPTRMIAIMTSSSSQHCPPHPHSAPNYHDYHQHHSNYSCCY